MSHRLTNDGMLVFLNNPKRGSTMRCNLIPEVTAFYFQTSRDKGCSNLENKEAHYIENVAINCTIIKRA